MTLPLESQLLAFDTRNDLSSSSLAVASGAFSVDGDFASFGNTVNAMTATLIFSPTFSIAPGIGETVAIFLRLLDVDGVNDQPIPTLNYMPNRVATIIVFNNAGVQHNIIDINLPAMNPNQGYQFYIWNRTSQEMDANCTLRITATAEYLS